MSRISSTREEMINKHKFLVGMLEILRPFERRGRRWNYLHKTCVIEYGLRSAMSAFYAEVNTCSSS